ncbi:MAG: flagellar basal-body MS-ring/collar protein FliF [Bacillota bacterium]
MNFRQLLSGLGEKWQALNQTRKVIAILIATGVLVALVIIGQALLSTPYAPLFTGLDPRDAGKITEELKKERTPYNVTDQGKTIEVPENMVYETRIKLASSGALYSSGVGFELFDQKKFGITEFEQQVGYQRALQEELRRTIVQVEAVEQARVHLVLPKRSLFLDEQTEPSASIALKIKPTAKISEDNVKGMVELVAGSVEGLKPENIHIIDMQGNSLSDNLKMDKSAALTKAALDRYELRRNFEKELESRVQNMLRQILGPGMAVAMVTAELNFDQEQYKATTYDKGQVLSEHNINEAGTGPGSAGGAPGTDSELPGKSIPAASGGGGGTYSKQETTTNYQVPNKEETVVKAPGSPKRLSVSVVLNGNYSEAQIKQVEGVVAAAIGYNTNRGDQIVVSSMTFDDSEKKEIGAELAKQKEREEQQKQLMTYGAAAIAGLAILVLALRYIQGKLRRRAERLAELRRQEEEARRRELLGEAQDEEQLELPKIASAQDEVREIATGNPEGVAEILKLWLKEQ